MIISEVLTVKGGEIFDISPDQPVSKAVGLMVEHDIGSLVVRGDDGRMVGLLTERDVIRTLYKRGCDLVNLKVSDLMITEPIIGHTDDTIDYVRGVMTDHRISHLPVLEGESLLGIISFYDVAKACLKEASFENRLLKRYIKHWPE